ncbi:predicted protein, partial [Naegleria gruberi]
MKRMVLNLQSICSFFQNDDIPIGRELNEFWIILIQREFYFPTGFIESKKEKIRPKAKRCYLLLHKMVEMKFNNDCGAIRNIQHSVQESNSFKVCVMGEGGAGKSNLCRRCANDDFFEVFDMGTVEEIFRKQISVNNQKFEIEFEEPSSYDEFEALRDMS